MGTVVFLGKLIHAMIDTCGAKSMIDRKTAEELKLDIQQASSKRHFGSYSGVGAEQGAYYYGRIQGPLEIHLSGEVTLILDELKVVDHFEPLLLIGTDVLSERPLA